MKDQLEKLIGCLIVGSLVFLIYLYEIFHSFGLE